MPAVHPTIEGGVLDAWTFANWRMLSRTCPPDIVRQRLMTEWTTLGIVCSLLATLAFPAFTTPPSAVIPQPDDEDPVAAQRWMQAYGILSGLSLILTLMVVGLATMSMIQLNLMMDSQLQWFIDHYEGITGVTFVTFVAAIFSIFGMISVVSVKLYEVNSVGLVTPIVTLVMFGLTMVFFGRVDLKRKEHAISLLVKDGQGSISGKAEQGGV